MKIHKYTEDIQCVYKNKGQFGSIYIGNIEAAQNIRVLRKYGIKSVVSVARGGFLTHTHQQLPNYLYIPALDQQDYSLSDFFEKSYVFIEKNLYKTNVLVHCIAGISRSVTIVIAYLIKKLNISFGDAYNKISQRRPKINPNKGFVKQLKQYQYSRKSSNKINPQSQVSISKKSFNKFQSTCVTPKQTLNINLSLNRKKRKLSIQDHLKQIEQDQQTLQYQIEQLRQRYKNSKILHSRLRTQFQLKAKQTCIDK